MDLCELLNDEAARNRAFPVTASSVFLAHAAVTALPRVAVEAIHFFTAEGSVHNQESDTVWPQVQACRKTAAGLLGCRTTEVALLGPTALGLSLVAQGLPWQKGDEVVYYPDDYPANVYPWLNLGRYGVRPVPLEPEAPGLITWPVVERTLSERTRLVALSSCHYLSGYRMDLDTIGRALHERGILLCVDGIQTLGAAPFSLEHVDFLAADSHKWLLGPVGAGVFYVKEERQEQLQPTLLGAWNVQSPEFVAQDEIRFEAGARRYEPGTMNLPGILGMRASIELLMEVGLDAIHQRIMALRAHLLAALRALGYRTYLESNGVTSGEEEAGASGIVAVVHPSRDLRADQAALAAGGIRTVLRCDRRGDPVLRLSPHFYNTEEELERVIRVLRGQCP